MANEKDVLAFWVRNDVNGDVAGPFTSTQMSEYLKKLPKDKYGYYKVKSSKWNEWKPLVAVIKEKSAADGTVPPAPPQVPGKASPAKKTAKDDAPPKAPKMKPVKTEGNPNLEISPTSGNSGFWEPEEEDGKSGGSLSGVDNRTSQELEASSSDDAFSDALASAESLSFESSINIEKAKILNNRQYPRFELDVEVTFIGAGGENFVTKTKDLSLGGMQFVDPVPMNLFEDSALVSLFYRAARQRFTANLMPVGDSRGFATRAFFNYLNPKNLEILHDWLKTGDAKQITDGRLAALKKKKS